jgi:hypothetical protein
METDICYRWAALPAKTGEAPAATGITGDRETAETHAGGLVAIGQAFMGRVEEVRRAMDADLEPCYQPTGRAWFGRRDVRGGILWFPQPVDLF